MSVLFRNLADLQPFIFRILDNGGATADRFTIIYCDGDYFAASCNPSHPQGVGMNGEGIDLQGVEERVEAGTERDLRWIDLPEAVRDCIRGNLNYGFKDWLEKAPAMPTREEARDWQGLWSDKDRDGNDVGPIYRDGDKFRIRDDDRDDHCETDLPLAFDTFTDAVRYMLPQNYDLAGPEHFPTVDLWDEAGGPAPLWDCEEDPPKPID
jgi:hypothetical protein